MDTVLIIGDRGYASRCIQALEGQNLDIIRAKSINEGLACAWKRCPDILIYECRAGTSPDELFQAISSKPSLATMPVIVLAEAASLDDMRRWMDAGADDYLDAARPPDGLIAAIRARLARKASTREYYDRIMDTLRYGINTAMPHEFRTSLVGILGFASLLREESGALHPHQIHDMAGYIEDSATRMHRLVENYAWYGRLFARDVIGASEGVPGRLTCDAPAEIIEMEAYTRAEMADRVGDLSITLENAPIQIIDEFVHKILAEVLDNAFKFSNPGTPIDIRTNVNGDYSIVIQDRGRGMGVEQTRHVGAYMQFDRLVHEQQGAGMGLAIATELARIHGGQVTIESAPGAGTTVCVALPLANHS